MLERIEISSDAEIYADTRAQTTITLRGKFVETRIETSGGLRLKSRHGNCDEVRLTSDLTQTPLPNHPTPLSEESLTQITNLARQLFPEHPRLVYRTLRLTLTTHHYEVLCPGGDLQRAVEEKACLETEWVVREKDGTRTFRETSARRNWKELVNDLKPGQWLGETIALTLRPPPVWPVPDGDIPIYWSPRAVAKICLPFLRAFEGDTLLDGRSLLADWPKDVALPFTIEETPVPAIDHEGQVTRPLVLFDGRRPRALLVDKTLAGTFAVESTGHARRGTYRERNEVLSWGAEIVAAVEAVATLPEWGLSVRDVELSEVNPRTGRMSLRLRDARLLHHGVEGEAIEPITLEISLLDLMRSWRAFSKDTETFGQMLSKHAVSHLTELKTPGALSPQVRLQGQVPPEHYW